LDAGELLGGGGLTEVGWVESAFLTAFLIQNFFCNFDGGADSHVLVFSRIILIDSTISGN
jgi:hypothetical protein